MKQATSNNSVADWKKWLKEFKSNPHKLAKEENLALCHAVMQYESVAEEYFYHTISPIVADITNAVRKSSNLIVPADDIKEEDIATLIYAETYDYSRWGRIRGFRGDTSFLSWTSMIAAQIVYPELVRQGILRESVKKSASEVTLALSSMQRKDELKAVIDLVEVKPLNDFLCDIYVKEMDIEAIKAKHNLDDKNYNKTVKVAELMLKEILLAKNIYLWQRTEIKEGKVTYAKVNLVREALGSTDNGLDITTSEDDFRTAENKFEEDDVFGFLEEIFDNSMDSPLREKWFFFIMDRVDEMKRIQNNGRPLINEIDELVWISLFVDGEAPEELAIRLNRRREWIDNKKRRIRNKVVNYIKDWFAKNIIK